MGIPIFGVNMEGDWLTQSFNDGNGFNPNPNTTLLEGFDDFLFDEDDIFSSPWMILEDADERLRKKDTQVPELPMDQLHKLLRNDQDMLPILALQQEGV